MNLDPVVTMLISFMGFAFLVLLWTALISRTRQEKAVKEFVNSEIIRVSKLIQELRADNTRIEIGYDDDIPEFGDDETQQTYGEWLGIKDTCEKILKIMESGK